MFWGEIVTLSRKWRVRCVISNPENNRSTIYTNRVTKPVDKLKRNTSAVCIIQRKEGKRTQRNKIMQTGYHGNIINVRPVICITALNVNDQTPPPNTHIYYLTVLEVGIQNGSMATIKESAGLSCLWMFQGRIWSPAFPFERQPVFLGQRPLPSASKPAMQHPPISLSDLPASLFTGISCDYISIPRSLTHLQSLSAMSDNTCTGPRTVLGGYFFTFHRG